MPAAANPVRFTEAGIIKCCCYKDYFGVWLSY